MQVNLLANHLQIAKDTFVSEYTRDVETPDGDTIALKAVEGACPQVRRCVFLEGKSCSVYEARPTQCRTYPFWPQHISGSNEWTSEAHRCEGIVIDKRNRQFYYPLFNINFIIYATYPTSPHTECKLMTLISKIFSKR